MNTVELVVLATTKVGENAVVVHTLSREYGRRGFMVRPGKKQGMALFLPLNILEADVVENPKSTLWSLRNILLKDGLSGIRGNLHKNTMTLFLSEVLFRTVREALRSMPWRPIFPTSTSVSCWSWRGRWASGPPLTILPRSRGSTCRN